MLLCLEWLVSNESIGAQHGGAVEQMYAKFKLALDDAVGYDFPLHRYSTFQDAPSLYKACWQKRGFHSNPSTRTRWKSNINRDWVAPGKALARVFEQGEQDYPREHWLFSAAPTEPGLLAQLKAARRPCAVAAEPKPAPKPPSEAAKAAKKELRKFKTRYGIDQKEDINEALEPLDKVWPLVRDEGRYSTAQDLSPALRSAAQVQADDGRWQAPPSKRAAAALLVTDCCGSVCAGGRVLVRSNKKHNVSRPSLWRRPQPTLRGPSCLGYSLDAMCPVQGNRQARDSGRGATRDHSPHILY